MKKHQEPFFDVCYLIEKEDDSGNIARFTTFDEDVILQEGTYKARPSFNVSAISFHSNLETDVCSLDGPLEDAVFLESFLKCTVRIYAFAGGEKKELRTAKPVSLKREDNRLTLELKGMTSAFDENFGKVFSPTCRARLGDAKCGVNLENFKVKGKVSEKAGDGHLYFKDAARTENPVLLKRATLLFTSGQNKGKKAYVKDFNEQTKVFTLWSPLQHSIIKGDSYDMTLGCDKRLETCSGVFKNALNFRGEPFVPTSGKLRTRVKV